MVSPFFVLYSEYCRSQTRRRVTGFAGEWPSMHTQDSIYRVQRRYLTALPAGQDLIAGLEAVCARNSIATAVFSLIGTASVLTIGTYDQHQQVYVTRRKEGFFEILNCTGNISRSGEAFQINARIMAADLDGRVWGGTLFPECRLFAGELDLQELSGAMISRKYDPRTGLMLWPQG